MTKQTSKVSRFNGPLVRKAYPWKVPAARSIGLGEYEEFDFEVLYVQMSSSEVRQMQEDNKDADQTKEWRLMDDILRKHVRGWKGLKWKHTDFEPSEFGVEPDDDFPFDDDALTAVLDQLHLKKALTSGFWEFVQGALAKN